MLKNIPANLAPIVDELRDHLSYFSELIEEVPLYETDTLRDKPEVLSKIKSFYSLCFSALAQDLNNKLTEVTGVETDIFSETFKAHGVEFHYNKLGRLAEQATSYVDLVVKMGVFLDMRATVAMPDLSKNPDFLISLDTEHYCLDVVESGPRVLHFLFPAFYARYDIKGFPQEEFYGYRNLLNFIGGALCTTLYDDINPFNNDFARAFTKFIHFFCANAAKLSGSFRAVPMLNQDSLAERKVDDPLGQSKLIPELIRAIFTIKDTRSKTKLSVLKEPLIKIESVLFLSEEQDYFNRGNKFLLIPTMTWAEPDLLSAEEASELPDKALLSGQAFEAVCVEFENAVTAYHSISVEVTLGKSLFMAENIYYNNPRNTFQIEFVSFEKHSEEVAISTVRLLNKAFF